MGYHLNREWKVKLEIDLPMKMEKVRHRVVEETLRLCNGNRTEAADVLGISRRQVTILINKYGIDIPPDTLSYGRRKPRFVEEFDL